MITQYCVDKIKLALRIDEVVGDYVKLKRQGSNMVGRCPFHDEKTGSFSVNMARGIFKCFGCGKSGDSVKFVMEHDQLNYPEALRQLAKKYNIEIEEKELSAADKIANSEKESLYAVNEFSRNYFKANAADSIPSAYFKLRGFTSEIIEKFQLGYAKDNGIYYLNEATASGYKLEYLLKLGLVKVNQQDEHYDGYRGRVIFPIHNVAGRIIGFGGRILEKSDKLAKYINSPQNEIYDKSKSLYGIYFAKESIVKNDLCFLVEGYTDVISLHQKGIKNVVASSGTALTIEQAKTIKRFTDNVTILYDGDSAGLKASLRGIDLMLEAGLNVKIVMFPDGEDPDSYSQKHSLNDLIKLFEGTDFIKFKTEVLLKDAANSPVNVAECVREIVNTISLIPDSFKRAMFARECAGLFKMDESLLINEINAVLRSKTGNDSIQEAQIEKTNTGLDYEHYLMCMLIQYGDERLFNADYTTVREYVVLDLMTDQFQFGNPIYNQIINLVNEHLKSSDSVITILNKYGDDELKEFLENGYTYVFFNASTERIHLRILNLLNGLKTESVIENIEQVISNVNQSGIDENITKQLGTLQVLRASYKSIMNSSNQ